MYRKLLPLILVFLLWLELPVILACPPDPTSTPRPTDTPVAPTNTPMPTPTSLPPTSTPEPTEIPPTPDPTKVPLLPTPVRPTNEPVNTPVPLPIIVVPTSKPKCTPVPPTPIMLLPVTGAEATPMLRRYPVVDVPWCSTGFLICLGAILLVLLVFIIAPCMLSSRISQSEEHQRLLAELKAQKNPGEGGG